MARFRAAESSPTSCLDKAALEGFKGAQRPAQCATAALGPVPWRITEQHTRRCRPFKTDSSAQTLANPKHWQTGSKEASSREPRPRHGPREARREAPSRGEPSPGCLWGRTEAAVALCWSAKVRTHYLEVCLQRESVSGLGRPASAQRPSAPQTPRARVEATSLGPVYRVRESAALPFRLDPFQKAVSRGPCS